LLLAVPAAARAQAPPNDHWASRIALQLPSQSSADVSDAGVDAGDPVLACDVDGRVRGGHSVWYSYTTGPDTEYVTLSTANSDVPVIVSVHEGAPGRFRMVAGGCNDDHTRTGAIRGLRLSPRTTYSIELATERGPLPGVDAFLSLTRSPLYAVTKTADTADGTCDADCSLREAITAATATPGAVVAPAGLYPLRGAAGEDANASGDLDVAESMGIYGAGAGQTIIGAGHGDRVLHVLSAARTVAVANVTLRSGTVDGDGGGLSASAEAFVDLDGVSIENSSASGAGGGIATSGRGRLVRSTVTANAADFGGGIHLGGAGMPFEVRASTLAGNDAAVGGGGIASAADLAIVNSTLTGNGGGGLLSGGVATLRSVTVAGNTGSARIINGASGITQTQGAIDVRNSVLADSRSGPDCSSFNGAFTAAYTHAEDAGGCDFSGAGDVTGSDPGLDPLAGNGGPTQTRRVLVGSPLLDSGDPAGCTDAEGIPLDVDQRGLPRAVNGDAAPGARCDEGAIEKPDELPVCTPRTLTTPEETDLSLAPLCTDPEGLPPTYDGFGALHGVIDGGRYRPAPDYNGPDTLAFVAHDEANVVAGSVGVIVTPVDDPPVARDDAGGLELAAPGLLANDSDAEGDALIAQVLTRAAHGTLLLAADGAYLYTPVAGFSGTDTFSYRARGDAGAASAPATVTIAVPSRQSTSAPTAPVVSKLVALRKGKALGFTLSKPAKVTIQLRRGKKVVKAFTATGKAGKNTFVFNKTVRRAAYTVQVFATDGALRSAAVSRKLRLGR
jgi:CSLREA domain-containing protein